MKWKTIFHCFLQCGRMKVKTQESDCSIFLFATRLSFLSLRLQRFKIYKSWTPKCFLLQVANGSDQTWTYYFYSLSKWIHCSGETPPPSFGQTGKHGKWPYVTSDTTFVCVRQEFERVIMWCQDSGSPSESLTLQINHHHLLLVLQLAEVLCFVLLLCQMGGHLTDPVLQQLSFLLDWSEIRAWTHTAAEVEVKQLLSHSKHLINIVLFGSYNLKSK